MSAELLDSVSLGKPRKHEVYHDLESFVWVFAYCIHRRLASTLPELQKKRGKESKTADMSSEEEIEWRHELEKKAFADAFGQSSVGNVYNNRIGILPIRGLLSAMRNHLSASMVSILQDLAMLVQGHLYVMSNMRQYMTHAQLLNVFDAAISKLENAVDVSD